MGTPATGFQIQARWDSRQVNAALSALRPKQWAFVRVLALTRTAQGVHASEKSAVQSVFDRPTPFTLNSLRVQSATVARPEARVWFKDPPRLTEREHYLMPQVHGGQRRQKRFEATLQRAGLLPRGKALVPSDAAPLDAYGNVTRSVYARILADLKASPTGANKRRGSRHFYGRPGNGRLPRGIWKRFPADAFGNRFSAAIEPVFLETRMPTYRTRFAFFTIAEQAAERVYQSAFERAVNETLRSAKS